MELLPLYSDAALPLWPGDPLHLHPLPETVDLAAWRLDWEHRSHGQVNFDVPRLRPEYVRLRLPASAQWPSLIAVHGLEYADHETVQEVPSADHGVIIRKDRYFRMRYVAVEPDRGIPLTRWARLLSAGSGFLHMVGLERQHLTWYQRNGDPYYVNQGALVLGFNEAIIPPTGAQPPLFPLLDRPEYGWLRREEPPLPLREAVPELIPAPGRLPSGTWRIETAWPGVTYNSGRRLHFGRDGGVRFDSALYAGAGSPRGAILHGPVVRQHYRRPVYAIGDGTVPGQAVEYAVPLTFGD